MKIASVILAIAMKHMNNKSLLCYALILLMAGASINLEAEENVKLFTSPPSQTGHAIEIKLDQNMYWYRKNNKEWSFLKSGNMGHSNAKEVRFLDVTGDANKDVFVKTFEAGANSSYALFISELKDNSVTLTERAEIFWSPYINSRNELISIQHDGPFSIIEKYRTEQQTLYRYELREPINSDLERVAAFKKSGEARSVITFLGGDSTAIACVTSNKAFLSNTPSSSGTTDNYLSKGETVSLIDISNDKEWIMVRPHGDIGIDSWLTIGTLEPYEPGECIE